MLPLRPLHLDHVALRLHGLPLHVSSDQGFSVGEGAVWCEQAPLAGPDDTGPVAAVSAQPCPDTVTPHFNIRREIEKPVSQIHNTQSPNVHVLFSSACVQQSAEIGNSSPPRACGTGNVNEAGIRAQVETVFAHSVAATPQGGRAA